MRAFAVAAILTAFAPTHSFTPYLAPRYERCPKGSHAVDLRFTWIPSKGKRRKLFDGPQRLLGIIYCSNGMEVFTTP